MERILEGVCKFQREVFPQQSARFHEPARGQSPEVLFITCSDLRAVPDLITQCNPGDLFICRNVGNVVPYGEGHGGVSATIEYAVDVLGVAHIVVCGHTDCGAMKGVMYPDKVAHRPAVKTRLNHGEVARRVVQDNYGDLPEEQKLAALIEENVIAQLEHLRTHPSVAARMTRGGLSLHGWVYDIGNGSVSAWDAARPGFVPIDQYSVRSVEEQRLRKRAG